MGVIKIPYSFHERRYIIPTTQGNNQLDIIGMNELFKRFQQVLKSQRFDDDKLEFLSTFFPDITLSWAQLAELLN